MAGFHYSILSIQPKSECMDSCVLRLVMNWASVPSLPSLLGYASAKHIKNVMWRSPTGSPQVGPNVNAVKRAAVSTDKAFVKEVVKVCCSVINFLSLITLLLHSELCQGDSCGPAWRDFIRDCQAGGDQGFDQAFSLHYNVFNKVVSSSGWR